jgi:hypothetical protein
MVSNAYFHQAVKKISSLIPCLSELVCHNSTKDVWL